MKHYLLIVFLFIVSTTYSQISTQQTQAVKAFIQRAGLDSISKEDLLKEKIIQVDNPKFRVIRAEAYFHSGESFKNVMLQKIGTNNLSWITRLNSIIEAKTPFKLTIAGIWYLNEVGKEELAEEFTLTVY